MNYKIVMTVYEREKDRFRLEILKDNITVNFDGVDVLRKDITDFDKAYNLSLFSKDYTIEEWPSIRDFIASRLTPEDIRIRSTMINLDDPKGSFHKDSEELREVHKVLDSFVNDLHRLTFKVGE